MDRPTDDTTDATTRTVTANGLEFAYLEDGPRRRAPGPVPARVPRHRPHLAPPAAPPGRRRLPRRGPVPAGLRADRGARRRSLRHRDPGPRRRAPSTRPWVAGPTPCSSATTGAALITYPAAATEPDRWRRAVTLAVPPPASLGFGFFDYAQLRRSWYVFLFQTPLAELAVGLDDHAFLDRLWADWSPGYDGTWDVARVKESIGDRGQPGRRHRLLPGHVRRAAGRSGGRRRPGRRRGASRPQPTLYLHGADDGCMGVEIIGPVTDHLAPGLRAGGGRGRRPLPAPRAARRGQRSHPPVPGRLKPVRPGRGEPDRSGRTEGHRAISRATMGRTASRAGSSVGTHRRSARSYTVPITPAWSVST